MGLDRVPPIAADLVCRVGSLHQSFAAWVKRGRWSKAVNGSEVESVTAKEMPDEAANYTRHDVDKFIGRRA